MVISFLGGFKGGGLFKVLPLLALVLALEGKFEPGCCRCCFCFCCCCPWEGNALVDFIFLAFCGPLAFDVGVVPELPEACIFGVES